MYATAYASSASLAAEGMLLISGCATFHELSPETRAEELTWRSLHAIDTAQTLWIAHDPECYFETVSDPVTGRHPSPGPVLAWMGTASVLHFAITDFLSQHTSPAAVRFWQGIIIGSTAYWVSHNYSVGLRVFSHNEHMAGTTCGDRQ